MPAKRKHTHRLDTAYEESAAHNENIKLVKFFLSLEHVLELKLFAVLHLLIIKLIKLFCRIEYFVFQLFQLFRLHHFIIKLFEFFAVLYLIFKLFEFFKVLVIKFFKLFIEVS